MASEGGAYSDDEVRAILDRALRKDSSQGVSHDELLAAAAEVGISAEAIEAAAGEVLEQRELERARQQIKARRRRGLLSHGIVFAAVQALLFLVNWLTTPGEWWFLFPFFGWGLGLFFHAWAALSKAVSDRAIRGERRRMQALQQGMQHLRPPQGASGRRPHVRIDSGAAGEGDSVRIDSGAAGEGDSVRVDSGAAGEGDSEDAAVASEHPKRDLHR